MKLWYRQPASQWCEALPTGNGRLGGMVFGKVKEEMIQLNEDSVWSGKPLNRINPDAAKYLDEVRRLLREGKPEEAERLAMYALSGTPNSERSYQTAGELYLNFHGQEQEEGYQRALDLETGVVSVDYMAGGVKYHREVISSWPAQILRSVWSVTRQKDFPLTVIWEDAITGPMKSAQREKTPYGLRRAVKQTEESDSV